MVRGITNFIQNAGNLLRPHKLQNTFVVVDGKNISFQLYLNNSRGIEFFGGDYDSYGRCVLSFFDALIKCNVTPIVIFDGNNEEKKLNTNFSRYLDRLCAAANYTPGLAGARDFSVFPLFLRTAFIDVINKMDVLVYRCEFAADNDIANLAKELNCPVISQDSDYYIYDVLYVPFGSLKLAPQLAQNQQYFLQCELYSCKYFLDLYPGLRWEHMTLIATVSGNDYIESDEFEHFHGKLGKQRGRAARMRNVINYLRNKPFETALSDILSSLATDRQAMARKIAENILGYKYSESVIPRRVGIKNFKKDDALKNEICGKLDQLVYTAFKKYFSADIFDCDRLDDLCENLQKVNVSKVSPDWFLRKNQTCIYPPPVFEIAFSIVHFLPAILENADMESVHSASFNIITAVNKIMSQSLKGMEVPLKVICRKNNALLINKHTLSTYDEDIVSLTDIPNLSSDEKFDVLLAVLGLKPAKERVLSALQEMPPDWHLFFFSVMYWKKNAKSTINDFHLCSAFLSAIILKIVDKKIGVERKLDELLRKHAMVLNYSAESNETEEAATYDEILKSISESECVLALQHLIPKFSFNLNAGYNKKIIHAFAELQSCIYFINSLNSLLDEPVPKILISEFYNDTFLYNIYASISSQEDVMMSLKALIPKSIIIANACKYFYKLQENVLKN